MGRVGPPKSQSPRRMQSDKQGGSPEAGTLSCPRRPARFLQAACLAAPLRAPCSYRSQTALGQAFLPRGLLSFRGGWGALSVTQGPLQAQ